MHYNKKQFCYIVFRLFIAHSDFPLTMQGAKRETPSVATSLGGSTSERDTHKYRNAAAERRNCITKQFPRLQIKRHDFEV